MADAWDGVGGLSTSGSYRARLRDSIPLLQRLAGERSSDPEQLFRAAVARFKADPRTRAKRLGLPVLLSQLEQWVDDAPGRASVASDADFSGMNMTLEGDYRSERQARTARLRELEQLYDSDDYDVTKRAREEADQLQREIRELDARHRGAT